jgi:hypothetical protein
MGELWTKTHPKWWSFGFSIAIPLPAIPLPYRVIIRVMVNMIRFRGFFPVAQINGSNHYIHVL